MTDIRKLNALFDEMKRYMKFDRKFNVILEGLEVLAILGLGTALGKVNNDTTPLQWIALFVLSIITILLVFRRMLKSNFFPLSALGELEATAQINEMSTDINRKRSIDVFIDKAVQALNSNTCNYSGTSVDQYLCDKSLDTGLQSVFEPYFQSPQFLIHTPFSRFTVGATILNVLQLPTDFVANSRQYLLQLQNQTIIPRDDLNFRRFFVQDMLHETELSGQSFYLQHQMKDTLKHSHFIAKDYKDGDKMFTFITAPIPQVCENAGNRGVFFLICEAVIPPSDLGNVTIIFSRLFSNWLSKYEDCVNGRIQKSNELFDKKVNTPVPPEIKNILNRHSQIKSIPSAGDEEQS